MAGIKSLNGVLPNFLGTFVSRYSSFEGELIFGKLILVQRELTIDLLATSGYPTSKIVVDHTKQLASYLFHSQLDKANVSTKLLKTASLDIVFGEMLIDGYVGIDDLRQGYSASFCVKVVSVTGKLKSHSLTEFIVPSDGTFQHSPASIR